MSRGFDIGGVKCDYFIFRADNLLITISHPIIIDDTIGGRKSKSIKPQNLGNNK